MLIALSGLFFIGYHHYLYVFDIFHLADPWLSRAGGFSTYSFSKLASGEDPRLYSLMFYIGTSTVLGSIFLSNGLKVGHRRALLIYFLTYTVLCAVGAVVWLIFNLELAFKIMQEGKAVLIGPFFTMFCFFVGRFLVNVDKRSGSIVI
ncbi:hypothetical protein PEPS_08960 [Persicobacter psychrovividus]|uniref:DUF998 domain-containing protein n=2 Tax=Persicobacter psychrovividus TaxID=387638 RepID=A0ABM7VCF7_9BACT|nr:hypothetical protein PEPS_08960 [Persicobacter psychrovividus]